MAKVGVVTKKMSQAEINVIEEKLSSTWGLTPVEIATHLCNRFDNVNDKINKIRSKKAYIERIKDKEQRVKTLKQIMADLKEANQERKKLISAWTKRVMDYVKETYGEERRDGHKMLAGYGDRIEVLRKNHMRKIW